MHNTCILVECGNGWMTKVRLVSVITHVWPSALQNLCILKLPQNKCDHTMPCIHRSRSMAQKHWPDLSKGEVMHYLRRHKYDCSPSIIIQDLRVDGITRTPTPEKTIQWLGVHFDRRLLFHHHVKTTIKPTWSSEDMQYCKGNCARASRGSEVQIYYKSTSRQHSPSRGSEEERM